MDRQFDSRLSHRSRNRLTMTIHKSASWMFSFWLVLSALGFYACSCSYWNWKKPWDLLLFRDDVDGDGDVDGDVDGDDDVTQHYYYVLPPHLLLRQKR